MISYSLVTAPAHHPITLQQAKTHLRIDDDQIADDALVIGLIAAATDYAETFTRRALITQTWDAVMDYFPDGDAFRLAFPPLQSVTSITYTDANGDSQTFSSTKYIVDTKSKPARIALAYQQEWPTTREIANAVTVRFVAGYGADFADVPEGIRLAMMMMIGHWYENREAVVAMPSGMTFQEAPESAKMLLWNHRVLEF